MHQTLAPATHSFVVLYTAAAKRNGRLTYTLHTGWHGHSSALYSTLPLLERSLLWPSSNVL